MARLRFPGRPGYRFGRLGLSYSPSERNGNHDKTTSLIANIHKGLRYFHEIFGESDEDEEFLGFSAEEVKQACMQVRKTQLLLEELQKPIGRPVKTSTRADRTSRTPALNLTQKSAKALYDTVITEGSAKPMKDGVSAKVLQLDKKTEEKRLKCVEEKQKDKAKPFSSFKVKLQFGRGIFQSRPKDTQKQNEVSKKEGGLKSPKQKQKTNRSDTEIHRVETPSEEKSDEDDVRYTVSKERKQKANRPDIEIRREETPSKQKSDDDDIRYTISKERKKSRGVVAQSTEHGKRNKHRNVESTVAKQILEKAKGKRIKKADRQESEQEKVPKNQFILPTVSSRSSRKIKPNKRFLEEGFGGGIGGITIRKTGGLLASLDSDVKTLHSTKSKTVPCKTKQQTEKLSPQSVVCKSHKESLGIGSKCVAEQKRESRKLKVSDGSSQPVKRRGRPPLKVRPGNQGRSNLTGRSKLKAAVLTKMKKSLKARRAIRFRPSKKLGNSSKEVKIGVLDLPPIVQGKRERKPSNKLLEKWTDEDSQLEHRQKIQAARISGKNILQKAKLRLNQRALNKSKKALVKSLKREMKSEGKGSCDTPSVEVKSPQFVPLTALTVQISPLKLTPSVSTSVPKFGALSLPKGPKPIVKGSKEAPTFGEKCDEEGMIESASEASTGDSRLFPMRCRSCGQRKRLLGSSLVCLGCLNFYTVHVKEFLKEGKQFPCDKIRDKFPTKGRMCPVNVRSAYWKQVLSTGGSVKFCKACRFKRCSQLICPPREFYNSHIKDKSDSTAKTTAGDSKAIAPKNVDRDEKRRSGCNVLSEERVRKGGSGDAGPVIDKDLIRHAIDDVISEGQSGTCPSGDEGPPGGLGGDEEGGEVSDLSETASMLSEDSRQAEESMSDSEQPATEETEEGEDEDEKGEEKENEESGEEDAGAKATEPIPEKKGGEPKLIAMGSVEEENEEELISPRTRSSTRGPRIKHVCRRASVALGKPVATFPDITLSALPNQEKEKVVQQEEDSDGASLEEPKAEPPTSRKTPAKSHDKVKTSPTDSRKEKPNSRQIRCGKCPACLAEECKECAHCLDMPKYGGKGVKRQSCVNRICKNRAYKSPYAKRQSIRSTYKSTSHDDVSNSGEPRSSLKRKRSAIESGLKSTGDAPFPQATPSRSIRAEHLYGREMGEESGRPNDTAADDLVQGLSDTGSELVDVEGVDDDDDDMSQPSLRSITKSLFVKPSRQDGKYQRPARDDDVLRALREQYRNTTPSKRPALLSAPPRARQPEKKPAREPAAGGGRMRTKLPGLPSLAELSTGRGDGFASKKVKDKSCQLMQRRASNAKDHTIKIDFKEDYDIDRAYEEGVALLSNTPFCVRAVCFLCGSQGVQKLLYCNVCCEPFHWYCLEESQRPLKNQLEDWCCPRCQFCHVCGKQSNLLKCTKCGDTYHPGCLGPNYPTKPTPRRVWLCTRCVKCRSCSRTTPGDKPTDKWTHDFALCQHCGELVDKGNFCPVCHQCYADDDWDVKMVQCESCEAWVHAKCEQISDEMYEIFSLLPEDTPFKCRVCAPGETRHMDVIMTEMKAGFKIILENLLSSSADCLQPIEDESTRSCDPETEESASVATGQECMTSSADTEETKKITAEACLDNLVPKDVPERGVMSGAVEDAAVKLGVAEGAVVEGAAVKPGAQGGLARPACTQVLPSRAVLRTMSEDSHRATPSPVSMSSMESTDSIPTDTSSDEHTSAAVGREGRVARPATETLVGHATQPVASELQDPSVSQPTQEGPAGVIVLPSSGGAPHDTNGFIDNIAIEMPFDITQEPLRRSARSAVRQRREAKERDDEEATTGPTGRSDEGGHLKNSEALQKSVTLSMLEPVRWGEDKKNFPRDLCAVKAKFDADDYHAVEEFCTDIVRILRYNIQQESSNQEKKKSNQACRNIFINKMETCFPWYNVNTSTLWKYDRSLPQGMLPEAVLPPSEDHTYAQWLERDTTAHSPQLSPFKRVPPTPYKSPATPATWQGGSPVFSHEGEGGGVDDVRKCGFCGEFGDKLESEAGRLLYTGIGEWAHVNCALWSAEVFEEVDGTLQNVFSALSRGRQLICNVCEKKGATVGCCARICAANFHLMCASQAGCVFQEDKKVFCREHRVFAESRIPEGKLGVERRSCVDLNNNKYNKGWKQGHHVSSVYLLVGSMCLESLGRLRNPLSDLHEVLLPVDYCVSRVYWSTKDPRRRCMYTCRIVEVTPEVFTSAAPARDVTVAHDRAHPDFNVSLHLQYTTKRRTSSALSSDYHMRRHSSALSSEDHGSELTLSLYGSEDTPLSENTSSLLSPNASHWPKMERMVSPGYEQACPKPGGSEPQVKKARAEDSGETGLLKMVERLNRAASRNKTRSRSSSRERTFSREGSVDRGLASPVSDCTASTVSVASPPPSLPTITEMEPTDESRGDQVALRRAREAATMEQKSAPQEAKPDAARGKMKMNIGGIEVFVTRPAITAKVTQSTEACQSKPACSLSSSVSALQTSAANKTGPIQRSMISIVKGSAAKAPFSSHTTKNILTKRPDLIRQPVKKLMADMTPQGGHPTTAAQRKATANDDCKIVNIQPGHAAPYSGGAGVSVTSSVPGHRVVIPATSPALPSVKSTIWRQLRPAKVSALDANAAVNALSIYQPKPWPSEPPKTFTDNWENNVLQSHEIAVEKRESVCKVTVSANIAQSTSQSSASVGLEGSEAANAVVTISDDESASSLQSDARMDAVAGVSKSTAVALSSDESETKKSTSEVQAPTVAPGKLLGLTFKDSFTKFLSSLDPSSGTGASPKEALLGGELSQDCSVPGQTTQAKVCNLRQPKDSEPSGFDLLDPELMSDIVSITPVCSSPPDATTTAPAPGFSGDSSDIVTEESMPAGGSMTTDAVPQLDGTADEKESSHSRTEESIHEKIMQKIKAESLARRSPTDLGATKCGKCKRVYRTLQSYNVHVKSCNFVVSSDDDDEEDDASGSSNVMPPYVTWHAGSVPSPSSVSPPSLNPRLSFYKGAQFKRVTVSFPTPEAEILGLARKKYDDDPDFMDPREYRSCRKPKKQPRSRQALERSLSPEQLYNAGPEAQIMYQGVPLVKTPFKRARGRPKIHKPVLVVPPRPRALTQNRGDEEDDSLLSTDLADNLTEQQPNQPRYETSPLQERQKDSSASFATSEVLIRQSTSRSAEEEVPAVNIAHVVIQKAKTASNRGPAESSDIDQKIDIVPGKDPGQQISLDMRSTVAYPTKFDQDCPSGILQKTDSVVDKDATWIERDVKSDVQLRESSPKGLPVSSFYKSTGVKSVGKSEEMDHSFTISPTVQILSQQSDVVKVNSGTSIIVTSALMDSGNKVTNGSDSSVYVRSSSPGSRVNAVKTVSVSRMSPADLQVPVDGAGRPITTLPSNSPAPQPAATLPAHSNAPRNTATLPTSDAPGRFFNLEALQNKLGQKVKVLSVSKDELRQLKQTLDRQKGVTSHVQRPSSAQPQVSINSNEAIVIDDSDSNPSPAVSGSSEPFKFVSVSSQVPASVTHSKKSPVPAGVAHSAPVAGMGSDLSRMNTPATVQTVQRFSPQGNPIVHRSERSPKKSQQQVSPKTLRTIAARPATAQQKHGTDAVRTVRPAPPSQAAPRQHSLDNLRTIRVAPSVGGQGQAGRNESLVSQVQPSQSLRTAREQNDKMLVDPQMQSTYRYVTSQPYANSAMQNSPQIVINQTSPTPRVIASQGIVHNPPAIITVTNQHTPQLTSAEQAFRVRSPVRVASTQRGVIGAQPVAQIIGGAQAVTQVVGNAQHVTQIVASAQPVTQVIAQPMAQVISAQPVTQVISAQPVAQVIRGAQPVTQVIRNTQPVAQLSHYVDQAQPASVQQVALATTGVQQVTMTPQDATADVALLKHLNASTQNVQSVTQLLSQQTQLVQGQQLVQASQLAQTAAGMLQNAEAGATFTIRTPNGDFQVISGPQTSPTLYAQNSICNTGPTSQPHIQQTAVSHSGGNLSAANSQGIRYGHSQPQSRASGPTPGMRVVGHCPTSSNAVNSGASASNRKFVISNTPSEHSAKLKDFRDMALREEKYKLAKSKLRLARKRGMQVVDPTAPTVLEVKKMKTYKHLGEMDHRPAYSHHSDYSRMQRKSVTPESARVMDSMLAKKLDRNIRSVLEGKLKYRAERPIIKEQKVHEKVLKRIKRSRKEPLRENIRHDTDSSVAHPLIHAARRQLQLPEPAVEEEVKDVPLYSIFGQKPGGSGLSLSTRKDRPHLRFEIESDDGFKLQADSWDEAWKAVVDKVQDARANARMKQLSFSGVNGLSMFGLSHSAVVYLVEQLFGAQTCRNYNFKYHQYERDEYDEEPEENPTGCARSEPFVTRKPYEMFSFLLSRYRKKPLPSPTHKKDSDMAMKSQRRATSLELPLAMRFRALKLHAKEAVGVYRSAIHGRGLFCKRDIDAGEMVIEYTGQVIRSGLTDKREKYYESKGIGCYMFRIDEDYVIDATLTGSAARFINHSCEPNCYSKIVNVDNSKHIVIFAMKQIKKGEELTYDYKFPIEDVKIPCTCNFKKCRKYLN